MEGLWLARSLLYSDVTEDGLNSAGLVMGMGTYGAVRLEDLRGMPVMTLFRTIREYEKIVKEKKDASAAG